MPRLTPLALILLAAGCAGPPEYSAPAPANALDCAVREAEHLGYTRMAGGEKEGFVRVEIRMPPAPAEDARTAPPPHATAAAPPPAPSTTVDRT
ncbi:MAG TPA: hypothetical protein VFI96_07905, partial [Longimicrobiaceae bacterium]|nr:hypothetical protein [Longimicrobiaceae bacterium]